MNKFMTESISGLSIEGLLLLVQSCEQRIGSNVAGRMPDEAYINKQRGIISLVEEEILKRARI